MVLNAICFIVYGVDNVQIKVDGSVKPTLS